MSDVGDTGPLGAQRDLVSAPFGFEQAMSRSLSFAALSGPFDPRTALAAADLSEDLGGAVAVTSALAAVCDTRVSGAVDAWIMRAGARRRQIARLVQVGALEEALRERGRVDLDPASRDIADALLGRNDFEPKALAAELQARETEGAPDRERLERLASALERAGPQAPAHPLLARVRAALNRLEQSRRSQGLLASGFHGRETHRAALSAWLADPRSREPVQAMFVSGLPAIGKSTLLEQALKDAAGPFGPPLVVRLDFDRSGLDVLDLVGLTLEAARQLAAQMPQHAAEFRRLRLAAVSTLAPELKGRGRNRLPPAVTDHMAEVVGSSGRAVVFVLDTLEALRARGETHPELLFGWLDRLLKAGVAPMAVIAAGRGKALDCAPGRMGEQLDLKGLEPEAADALLERIGVPEVFRGPVQAAAGDNPLQLKLAGALVLAGGAPRAAADLDAAHLHRTLSSRVGRRLGALITLAPVLRRISAPLLAQVLAPSARIGRLTSATASQLLAEFAAQRWLVRPDAADGWLQLDPEVRRDLLPRLHRTYPSRCATLDRAAARWFSRQPEPWARAESLYHRLQATRTGGRVPAIDPEIAWQFERGMLDDLPEPARDLVLRARGERSSVARGGGGLLGGPAESGAFEDLRLLLGKGDISEAAHVYDAAIRPTVFDADSPDADAARTFLWEAGRWREARRLLQERDWIVPEGDTDLVHLSDEDFLARAQMRAEFDFRSFVHWLQADAGHVERTRSLFLRRRKIDLSQGALAFALLIAEPRAARVTGTSAGVVLSYWTSAGDRVAAARTASALADDLRARAGVNIEPGGSAASPENDIRALASLSPYGEVAGLVAAEHGDGAAQDWTRRLIQQLPDRERSGRVSPSADPFAVLPALGLASEWIGAAALRLRSPDLRLIARSAERWRRTSAGVWSFARRLEGWRSAGALDLTTASRVEGLLAAHDPVASAIENVRFWTGGDDPAGSKARLGLQRWFRRAVEIARREAEFDRHPARLATAVAAALLRGGAAAAFASPMAVLAALGEGMPEEVMELQPY